MAQLGARRFRIALIQQGVWATAMESMPLAMGYLKSTIDSDPDISSDVEVTIHNFDGGHTLTAMANRLFGEAPPDLIAFSVLGWNVRTFGALAETFKQLNPDGTAVFGGTHVANQADRVLRLHPDVDIIANGEGEFTMLGIVKAMLDPNLALADVPGISFHDDDGVLVTTPDPPRIEDLDTIPSPFLTGSIDMLDARGEFRYDVALMETNRGCPYKCSFCYWGGAVGQKVRAFSLDRLMEEVEFFAFHKVDTIVLCDANFALLRGDRDFVEHVVKVRERTGYPRSIETSWAKNKSAIFYDIVKTMKEGGLRSSFTLALQTVNDAALTGMNRHNMKVNQWEDLVAWLQENDLDCYAELIWGAPGETVDSFLKGYDELAVKVPRIAAYPLLLLPNTHYSDHRTQYGFKTVRGDSDDFEYILQHNTMTVQDNRQMQQFLFWARTVGENAIFRNLWQPIRDLGGMSQSEVLISLKDWFNACESPVAAPLQTRNLELVDAQIVSRTIHYLYEAEGVDELLHQWWAEAIVPRLPPETRDYLTDVFVFDLATRPLFDDDPGRVAAAATTKIDGAAYYVQQSPEFRHDVPAALAAAKASGVSEIPPPTSYVTDLFHKVGFRNHLDSHEVATQYRGKIRSEVERETVGS